MIKTPAGVARAMALNMSGELYEEGSSLAQRCQAVWPSDGEPYFTLYLRGPRTDSDMVFVVTVEEYRAKVRA